MQREQEREESQQKNRSKEAAVASTGQGKRLPPGEQAQLCHFSLLLHG